MRTSVTRGRTGTRYYYYCSMPREGQREYCPNRKTLRAERVEAAVWGFVSELLTDPERIRVGLEAMAEQERQALRGDPAREAKAWLEKLAEIDGMRAGYQEQAAKDLMTLDELAAKLKELDETRRTAEDELEALRRAQERREDLERDKESLLAHYAGIVPEKLALLEPEERNRIYGMLRLKFTASADGTLEGRGILSESLHVSYDNGRAVCETEPVPYCVPGGVRMVSITIVNPRSHFPYYTGNPVRRGEFVQNLVRARYGRLPEVRKIETGTHD